MPGADRRRWRAVAAAIATVLVCASCGSGGATPSGKPTPSATATPSKDPIATYAVDPPGEREGALVSADVMIAASDPLADETVTAVRKIPGVRTALRISVAQVSLENKLYTVAAVDPSQYRRYTPAASDRLQEQWDRVAGGEVAVAEGQRKKLPVDRDGYLALTLDDVTKRVHVGAFAPQVSGIDLVVNTKIGEALGMRFGNALLLSTGQRSPDSLRKPIARAVGKEASVQNLDVVAQLGLDPDVFQNVVYVGPFADAVGVYRYTPIGGRRVQPEASWVSTHISTEVVPILGSVTCNKAIFPQLKAALQEVVQTGLAQEIHAGEYAGCYYPRFIAGTTTLSNHSFGLALDFNVPGNQRGTVGQMDRGVVAIFKRWGFAWGGDWNYTDPMHFELRQLVRPG